MYEGPSFVDTTQTPASILMFFFICTEMLQRNLGTKSFTSTTKVPFDCEPHDQCHTHIAYWHNLCQGKWKLLIIQRCSLWSFRCHLHKPQIISWAASLFFWLLLLLGPMHRLQPVLLHVRFHFPHCASLFRIQSQDLAKHLHGLWCEPLPQWGNVVLSLRSSLHSAPVCKLYVKVVWIHAALPREVACKDAEDNNAKGPGVQARFHTKRGRCHFLLAFQQGHSAELRGHVGQRSRDVPYQSTSLLGQAEVSQLDLAAVVVQQQDIFRFDIPVNQTVTVDELQSTGNLEDTAFYRRFWNAHLERVGQRMDVALVWFSRGVRHGKGVERPSATSGLWHNREIASVMKIPEVLEEPQTTCTWDFLGLARSRTWIKRHNLPCSQVRNWGVLPPTFKHTNDKDPLIQYQGQCWTISTNLAKRY